MYYIYYNLHLNVVCRGQRLWNSQSLISLPKIVFLIFIFVLCKFMKPELMSIIRVKINREKEGGNA